VVVLGPTGRNFAAGMSGGVAYVLDEGGDFAKRCNQQMVGLEKLQEAGEIGQIRLMIERHAKHTQSQRAAKILASWEEMAPKFVKVMPKDYKRMLEEICKAEKAGLSGEEAVMAAFEANAKNAARVGGG
jgi:glutamate synthase (ferredoxin)